MSFDPIDSLNTQILNAIGATVADATEKQNAADAIETFLNSNNFVKEVLNDTLRDDIVNNHNSFAIVEVDSENVVVVSDVSPNKAIASQKAIKKKARRDAITTTYINNMDTGSMTQQQIDDQTDILNSL